MVDSNKQVHDFAPALPLVFSLKGSCLKTTGEATSELILVKFVAALSSIPVLVLYYKEGHRAEHECVWLGAVICELFVARSEVSGK